LHINGYLHVLQRMFIRQEPSKASVQRCMYTNFKIWVEETFPHGITEDDWNTIEDFDFVKVNVMVNNSNIIIACNCIRRIQVKTNEKDKIAVGSSIYINRLTHNSASLLSLHIQHDYYLHTFPYRVGQLTC